MSRSYLDHPSEEALERFLLHNAQEDELDRVETHILSCDACITRLEELEVQLAAVKLALQEISRDPKPASAAERRFRRDWFTFRTLSWASAVAALALVATLTPRFAAPKVQPVDLSLSATRGSDIPAVPHGRPLHMHLSALDISNGAVRVALVEGDGSEVWNGTAKAQDERVDVTVPKIDHPGTHFVRLYSLSPKNSPGDLLREFPFEVK